MPDVISGGCGCGAVRYAIDQPLTVAGYCHCTRCQRRTGGGAAVSGRVVPGSFRVTRGEELIAAWRPPEGFAKAFCAACGSALYAQHPTDASVLLVRLGTVDGDPGIRPSFRQFVAYAAPWEPIPDDGLERFPERRPA